MNAGEQDSRMVGVRVLAVLGPMRGHSGVVADVKASDLYLIRWDDGGADWYSTYAVILESQALSNVRVIP